MGTQQPVRRSYPKKITTSMIGLDTARLEKVAADNTPSEVPVMRFYGRVKSTETVNTAYGQSTRFKGEFEAINLLDNSIHRSQQLFVPSIAEQVLTDLVAEGKEDDKEAWVKCGADILVSFNPSTKGGTKFRFGVRPLVEPKGGEDVLSQIGRELGAPPALPAPKVKGKK